MPEARRILAAIITLGRRPNGLSLGASLSGPAGAIATDQRENYEGAGPRLTMSQLASIF